MIHMLSSVEKKWRLFRAWTSRHPLWCAWQVTYRCNFRCRFCHYWRDPAGMEPEPSVARYRTGSKKLASYGTLMVSIAGGEPMLRRDLPEIIEAVGEYHFPFVTTNGWFVTPKSAREMMQAGVWGVSVSIDYADPALHDRARGMDGAWQQAWRAVELLAAARVHDFQRVNVIAVLVADNIDHMEPLTQMAAERNAYFMVQPYGFRKTGAKSHAHNDGAVAGKLLALRKRYRNFLSNPYYLERFDRFLAGGIPGCRAGRAFFNIDAAGNVAKCVESRATPVANIYRNGPGVIHKRLRAAAKANTCTDCWYNCRGEIESLYSPIGLAKSLPTILLDRGEAPAR